MTNPQHDPNPEQDPSTRPYAEHLDESEIDELLREADGKELDTARKDRLDTRVYGVMDDPDYKARLAAAEDILNPVEVPSDSVKSEVDEDPLAIVKNMADYDFGPGSPEEALNAQMLREHIQKGPNPNPKPEGLKDRVWKPVQPPQNQ